MTTDAALEVRLYCPALPRCSSQDTPDFGLRVENHQVLSQAQSGWAARPIHQVLETILCARHEPDFVILLDTRTQRYEARSRSYGGKP